MKNTKSKIILLILAVSLIGLLGGCDDITDNPKKLTSKISVGIVRGADVIPTSFNECMKTQVYCDSLYLVVYGLPKLKLGREAFIETYSNGDKYFVCADYKYKLYK